MFLRSQSKLVQRERDRIKKDDEMADRIGIAELESIHVVVRKVVQLQKAFEEFEGSTQTGSTKAMRLREQTQQRETELGTALTLVRRAELQALLEQERDRYVTELNRLGKAIYKQRLQKVVQLQKAFEEFEGSTQTGSTKAMRLREQTQQRETELGKTLTLVRRVLEQEIDRYVTELNRLHKAIYKQRV